MSGGNADCILAVHEDYTTKYGFQVSRLMRRVIYVGRVVVDWCVVVLLESLFALCVVLYCSVQGEKATEA